MIADSIRQLLDENGLDGNDDWHWSKTLMITQWSGVISYYGSGPCVVVGKAQTSSLHCWEKIVILRKKKLSNPGVSNPLAWIPGILSTFM